MPSKVEATSCHGTAWQGMSGQLLVAAAQLHHIIRSGCGCKILPMPIKAWCCHQCLQACQLPRLWRSPGGGPATVMGGRATPATCTIPVTNTTTINSSSRSSNSTGSRSSHQLGAACQPYAVPAKLCSTGGQSESDSQPVVLQKQLRQLLSQAALVWSTNDTHKASPPNRSSQTSGSHTSAIEGRLCMPGLLPLMLCTHSKPAKTSTRAGSQLTAATNSPQT